MSYVLGRRKSSLKLPTKFKEPVGPILKFQWSVSAAKSILLEEKSSAILPSINTNRSKQKRFAGSPPLTHRNSASRSSISTQKRSPVPNTIKKKSSKLSTTPDNKPNDTRNKPLLLTYSQVHYIPLTAPSNRLTRTRLSIYPMSSANQSNVSDVNSRISFASRRSISPPTTLISLLSPTVEHPSSPSPHNLVRLHTPQLRDLNVSEKYMNEAKKLYFNAECRSFVPRLSVAQVS